MNVETLYNVNLKKLMSLVNFEYDKFPNKRQPGFHLDRVNYLMKTFNYPNKSQNFIHIAGSKGKGSTANLVSNGLSEYKVGLFTSPHMHSIRERIKINNKPISKTIFNKYFNLIWPVVIKMKSEKFNELNSSWPEQKHQFYGGKRILFKNRFFTRSVSLKNMLSVNLKG